MPDSTPLAVRLRKGLVRIDADGAAGEDPRVRDDLRRSLERTLARLEAGGESAPFSLRLTGGTSLLYHGTDALPLEASRLSRLLSSMDVELRSGEALDLDGGLAAWAIRPEVTLIDTNLRHLEDSIRTMKLSRDRDHAASQTAETSKVRLRSRFTRLVGALQAAQRDAEAPPAPAP
ncbi:MAG TPA: hypothetical protein VF950_25355 [Planctomycetota bacterium]